MSAKVLTFPNYNDAESLQRTYLLPLNKLDATAAPGTSNDDTQGYVAGSVWADRTNNKVYHCTDNATGAATWVEAGSGGGGSGDVTAASAFGTDNRVIRSDGAGKGVQASGITIDDTDNISGVATINGMTITPYSGNTLSVFNGKTFAVVNTMTLTAPADGNTLNIGTGGTLDSAAFLPVDTDGTLAANSDAKIATQKATKTYVDNAVTGLLDLKGSQDCSANPNYPAASKGDSYYVTVAGKIGGASGKSVDVGDVYVAKADNAGGTEASVGTSWFVLEHNLVGALLSANNLSDLANAATARANLGAAPNSADCLVKTANSELSAERVVSDQVITWDWSNPGIVYAQINGNSGSAGAFDSLTQAWSVASASTVGLTGGGTGICVTITGTTTITAFSTASAGVVRIATFSGALTLTHNATSLILPTAANITTAAGDTAIFVSLGSGNWKCIGYFRASGASLTPAHTCQMRRSSAQTITANTATKISLDTIDSGIDVGGMGNTTNNRIDIKRDGRYLINGSCYINLASSGLLLDAYIYKNGSNVKFGRNASSGVGDGVPAVWIELDLVAGDYVELWIYYQSGTFSTSTSSALMPMISVVEVR